MCKPTRDEGRATRDEGYTAARPGKAGAALTKRQGCGRPSLGFGSDRRGGFTLVELMVVIVIIMILVGLLTPVLVNVMARAREARITAEIAAIDGSIKAYKERYGAYPPSNFAASNAAAIQLHLAHAFPHCNAANEIAAIPGGNLSPAQALVFWLSGFSPDPEHPISGHYGASSPLPLTPFYQFDTTRLLASGTAVQVGNSPVPVYTPTDGLGAPYVYFYNQDYAWFSGLSSPPLASQTPALPGTPYGATQGGSGVCRPYYADNGSSTNGNNYLFVNPNSYQIISAGLDGDYGDTSSSSVPSPYPSYPSGNGYTPGDLDNLVNFWSGNLKDATSH